MAKCVVCGRERIDLIDDQCADCTMDDFWASMGRPRQFAPYGQGDILASLPAPKPPLKHYFITYEIQDRDTGEIIVSGGKNVDAYRREDAGSQLAEELRNKYGGMVTIWDIEEVGR